MTNPTCPFDHDVCTPNYYGISKMDGHLNCGGCSRYKMPEVIKPLTFFDETTTIAATGLCHVDPGSPEGDKMARVGIVCNGPITATAAKSFLEMGVDVVIVGQPEVPGRTITATPIMPIMAPPDIPCFEIEQKKRHQPKGHERPYKFHK